MKQAKTQTWLGKVAAKKPGILKAWLFLFLGVSSALALPLSLPQTAQAQAAGYAYIDTDIYKDVTAYIWRNAIGKCVFNNNDIPANYDEVDAGEWFSNDTVTVTPLLDSDDAERHCSTPFTVNRASEAFGFDSPVEAACYFRLIETTDGSACYPGSGGEYTNLTADSDYVLDAIDRKRFYNPNDPINPGFNWNGPRYYALYARSFEIGCRATPFKLYDEATTAEKSRADNLESQLVMTVVGADGVPKRTIYKMAEGYTRSTEVGMTVTPELNNQHRSCAEIVDLANQYADDYAQHVAGDPPAEGDQGSGATDEEAAGPDPTQCDVEGIGWLVCPVMLFMGKLVDNAYSGVAFFLEVQPISTDTQSPLFQAWSLMRNFANVAFVIVFLIIIYSQITSVGISNYNIKKMLPRLIVAAILVNVSYWVCAIAVDVSNILGTSIKSLFDTVAGQLYPTTSNLDVDNNDGGWLAITIAVVGGAVAVYVGLSMLLPLLVGALISVITALIILTLRQAFIIILIVLSPLAFVAFLLPNTQSLFNSWRKLFQTLLLMFPLIAVIFGGSALAGVIIQQSAGDNIGLQLLALGVTIIPLFITVFISKMLQMLGGIAGRLTGMVNDPAKGTFDRMRRGAEGMRDRQQMRRGTRSLNGGKFLGSDRYKRRAKREAINAGVESEFKRSQGAYVAGKAATDEAFQNRLAGGLKLGPNASPEALNRAMATAINVQAKIEAEEVTAASAIIRDLNLNAGDLRKLAAGGDVGNLKGSSHAVRSAAMKKVIDTQDVDGINDLLNNYGSMDDKTRQSFADHLESSSSRPKYISNGAIGELRQKTLKAHENTKKVSDELIAKAIENNTYSVDKIASADKDELQRVVDVAKSDQVPTNNTQIIENATKAQTDPRFAGQIGKNVEQVQRLTGPLPSRPSSFGSGSASRGPRR